MNINCYIVDDEEHAIELLTKYIKQTPGLEFAGADLNPLETLNKINTSFIRPDITFVDIGMAQLSGVELASLIINRTEIIFTTAFPDYAVVAFDKNVVDYMLKPFTYERFLQSINKAIEKIAAKSTQQPDDGNYFYVQTDGNLMKIIPSEVIYIEASGNYIKIHTNNDSHIAYLTMKEIEDRLPPDKFVRVHKSFLINTLRIKVLERSQIIMENDMAVPLGASYRQKFMDDIKQRILKSKRASSGS